MQNGIFTPGNEKSLYFQMSCLPEKVFPLRNHITNDARLPGTASKLLNSECGWKIRCTCEMNTAEIDTRLQHQEFFNRNINGFIHLTVDPGEKVASSEDRGRGGLSLVRPYGPPLLSSCIAWS